jgi:hypothetical protein
VAPDRGIGARLDLKVELNTMRTKSRPKIVKTEADMSQAVACTLGKYAAREVRVGDCIFDVVAYNKAKNSFRLIECKRSRKASGIGQAFGQLAAYSATIATHGREFLVAYSKKLDVPMHQGRWLEATDDYRRITVEFYVALTDKACKRVDLLRSMKNILSDVGIIRVKADGYCRNYLWVGRQKDTKVAQPRPVSIKILPYRNND